jgi:hypothetical protein
MQRGPAGAVEQTPEGHLWRAWSLSARVGKRAHVWTNQHKRRGAAATSSRIALGARKTTRAFFKRCAMKRSTVVLLVTLSRQLWRRRSRRKVFIGQRCIYYICIQKYCIVSSIVPTLTASSVLTRVRQPPITPRVVVPDQTLASGYLHLRR